MMMNQMIGKLRAIAGTILSPRASTDVCLKILKHSILPTIEYAPVALCTIDDNTSQKINKKIRKAARIALHGPSWLENNYVYETSGIEPDFRTKMIRRARKYINSDKRPNDMNEWTEVNHARVKTTIHRHKRPTVLNVLKDIE